jgi:flagellin
MPIGIVYNQSAVSARTNLASATASTQSSIQRLSSGGKITRASDDVAGLAVGTQLQSNVTVLKAAANNVQQANALLAVADGALDNIGQMLQRMNSLASQATSAALNDSSRAYLNQEYLGLMDEIDRIASNTKFNGTSLIDGSFGAATSFDETTGNAATISVDAEATTHGLDVAKLRVVQSADNETVVLDMSAGGASLDFDLAANDLFGDFQGLRIIQGTGGDNGNTITTSTWEAQVGGRLYIARDVVDDLDNTAVTFTEFDPIGAARTFTMTNNTGADLALTNQVDANRLADAINYALKGRVGFQVGTTGSDKVNIGIMDSSSGALGIHQTRIDSVGTASVEANDMVTPNIGVVTGYGASEAVDRISKAIESVLANRAAVGAYTSRFDKAFNAISTSVQNQDAARSVYLDADVAEESSNLAASQVKMNASISVLAQANEMSRSLLKLMG